MCKELCCSGHAWKTIVWLLNASVKPQDTMDTVPQRANHLLPWGEIDKMYPLILFYIAIGKVVQWYFYGD